MGQEVICIVSHIKSGSIPCGGMGLIRWTPFNKPLSESSLAIISTAGFYLEDDKPFDIDSALGDVSYRIIPSELTWEMFVSAQESNDL